MTDVDSEIVSVSADRLAAQITLNDLEVFKRINVEEITSLGWTDKLAKADLAPNVVEFTRRFNSTSYLTCKVILSGESVQRRAELIGYFIKLAKVLHAHNNLHGAYAVLSALGMQPIYRLDKSWEKITKSEKSAFARLTEFFSEANNFNTLRLHTESTPNPCIPHLGLYLTDIVFISYKLRKSAEVQEGLNRTLRMICSFQDSNYEFVADAGLRSRLAHYALAEATLPRPLLDALFARSERVEPAGAEARRSSLPAFAQRRLAPALAKTKRYSVSPAASTHFSPAASLQRALLLRRGHRKTGSLDEASILGTSSSRPTTSPGQVGPQSPSSPDSTTSDSSCPVHERSRVSNSFWYDTASSNCSYNPLNNEDDDEDEPRPQNGRAPGSSERGRVGRSSSSASMMADFMRRLRLRAEPTASVRSARLPRRAILPDAKRARAAKSADTTPNVGRKFDVIIETGAKPPRPGAKPMSKSLDGSDIRSVVVKVHAMDTSPLLAEPADPEIGGVFSRTQTCTKNGKVKLVRSSHTCYLELRDGLLLEFERRLVPLRVCERRDLFQTAPRRVRSVRDGEWRAARADARAPGSAPPRPGFELRERRTGRVFHYACANWSVAAQWARALDDAAREPRWEPQTLNNCTPKRKLTKSSLIIEDCEVADLDLEERKLDEDEEFVLREAEEEEEPEVQCTRL